MGMFLPPDILFSILVRLPAKSIFRLRCVCKLFSSLTSDPAFLRSRRPTPHLLLHPTRHESSARLHLLSIPTANPTPTPTPTLTLSLMGKVTPPTTPDAKRSASFSLSLFTSCDGMLCFRRIGDYFRDGGCCICDPATDSWHVASLSDFSAIVIGFYSHPPSGDYRLLWLREWPELQYAILSLTTGTLRRIGPFLSINRDSCPVEFHGSLHWLGYYNEGGFRAKDTPIIAFDVEAEEFREIKHPEFRLTNERDRCLMVMEGRLSLCDVTHVRFESTMRVWALSDGVWTKRHNISILPLLKTLGGGKVGRKICVVPLTAWGDREILMEVRRRGGRRAATRFGFILYDLSGRGFRGVDVGSVDAPTVEFDHLLFAHYKENLASPIKSFKAYCPDAKPN